MTPSSPPNRWRVGVALLVGTSALAFIHSRALLGWAYSDVTAMSAEYRQSVLTVGIFASGVAAWTSSAISSPTNAHAPAGSSRRGLPLAASNIMYLSLAAGLGFTLGLAPVTISSISHSDYGSVDLATIASGYAALLAYIATGYLIGCLLPYLAVPAALGVAYVMVFFSSTAVSPIFEFDIISGLEVPTKVSVARLLYFLASAGAAFLASSMWLRKRSTNEIRAAASSVAMILFPLLVLTYASTSYTPDLVVTDGATPVCQRAGESLVCVHPARSDLLADLADAVAVIGEQAGPEVFPPSNVFDATLDVPSDAASSSYLLQIQGQSSDWLRAAIVDLASRAAGVQACSRSGIPRPEAEDASRATGAWILQGVGVAPEVIIRSPGAQRQFESLQRLGPERARKAIERDVANIRLCAGARIL